MMPALHVVWAALAASGVLPGAAAAQQPTSGPLPGVTTAQPASGAGVGATQAPLEVPILAVQGSVTLQDGSPVAADQRLRSDATVVLAPKANVRFATPCGEIVLAEGPAQASLAELGGRTAARASPCDAPPDDAAAARRRIVLTLLERSPTRVFRGAGQVAPSVWDIDLSAPGQVCVRAGTVPRLTGDRMRLGNSVEMTHAGTGTRALAERDETRGGWTWPEGLPIQASDYRFGTRLAGGTFRVTEIANAPTDPAALVQVLMSAGCAGQAFRLLPALPPDIRSFPKSRSPQPRRQ